MRLKILWPLIVVAVIGLVIVICAEPISRWVAANRAAHNGAIIGRLVSAEGSVRRIHGADIELVASPVAQPLDLRDGDRVQTSVESKAVVVLNSADEFLLGPGSEIQFQLWNAADANSPIYVHSLLGALTLNRGGVRGKAYVVKDGRLYVPGQTPQQKALALTLLRNAPLDMHLAESQAASDEASDTATDDSTPVATGTDPETLSNEYIDDMILTHQAQLQRCWLSRLKDEPALKGQIVVQFEISKRGKVKDARVADASLNDEILQKCVLSVIERIPFRSFKGSEISLSYPIKFE